MMDENYDTIWLLDDLPRTLVHNISTNFYSEYYQVDDMCECGQVKWYNSTLETMCPNSKVKLTPQRVQRCSYCDQLRMSRMKKKYETILEKSTKLLNTLKKISDDDQEWFTIIGTMYAKLGKVLHGEKMFHEILSKMKFKEKNH